LDRSDGLMKLRIPGKWYRVVPRWQEL